MASREAELEARGYGTWVRARQDSDFATFAPVLEDIVGLKTEVAKVRGRGKWKCVGLDCMWGWDCEDGGVVRREGLGERF